MNKDQGHYFQATLQNLLLIDLLMKHIYFQKKGTRVQSSSNIPRRHAHLIFFSLLIGNIF